jgi:hypothetical protein
LCLLGLSSIVTTRNNTQRFGNFLSSAELIFSFTWRRKEFRQRCMALCVVTVEEVLISISDRIGVKPLSKIYRIQLDNILFYV